MKKIIALSFILLFASKLSAFECQKISTDGEATRWQCEINSKTFSVLNLKGSYPETVRQHTRLMSKEIVEGPMGEVIRSIRTDLSQGSVVAQQFKKAVFDCYYQQMRASVSNEFLRAGRIFSQTLSSQFGGHPPYRSDEFEKAVYAIEMSIAAEGLMRKLDEDPLGTTTELATSCGIQISYDLLKEILDSVNPFNKLKLGCLGFVSPASSSVDGVLMHARNLDANLVDTWNREPVLFLVEEPGYLKYAAVASAGVIYPGGISGMNEDGISVSLHEFSTTHYRTYFSNPAKWLWAAGSRSPMLIQISLSCGMATVERTL